jgi:hypothetical protein
MQWSSDSVASATGALLYGKKIDGNHEKDLVIVCYHEEWSNVWQREVIETLSAPGLFRILFLTPEEIVERYGSKDGEAEGGNGFH